VAGKTCRYTNIKDHVQGLEKGAASFLCASFRLQPTEAPSSCEAKITQVGTWGSGCLTKSLSLQEMAIGTKKDILYRAPVLRLTHSGHLRHIICPSRDP
jgi:hypothetical protein